MSKTKDITVKASEHSRVLSAYNMLESAKAVFNETMDDVLSGYMKRKDIGRIEAVNIKDENLISLVLK